MTVTATAGASELSAFRDAESDVAVASAAVYRAVLWCECAAMVDADGADVSDEDANSEGMWVSGSETTMTTGDYVYGDTDTDGEKD